MSESPNILYSIYGYIGISIFSSLMRYDFNVFFSYLILFLYSLFYPNNKIGIGKLIIHIICGVIIGDIIWMIFMLSYYSSSQPTNQWKFTSGLRSLMNFFAFCNLIIKGVIGYYFFDEFKNENGDINDLMKLGDYFNDNSPVLGKSNIHSTPLNMINNNNLQNNDNINDIDKVSDKMGNNNNFDENNNYDN
jgi:hypothetical protein